MKTLTPETEKALVEALQEALFYAVRRNLMPDKKLIKARDALAKARAERELSQ